MKISSIFIASCICLRAAPCITPTVCSEWITFGGGPSRSLVYRTYSLETRNPGITRALVMVHGAGRDADNYFRSSLAAAFLAGALEDTLVVAPRFASKDRNCNDALAENEVSWSCSGDSWRSGGTSVSDPKLTSYDFSDEILRKLARKDVFPNLKQVVLAGHSAGGQFIARYVMATPLHETLGVPVRYIVSNPSSYAYLDAMRPAEQGVRHFGDARNCTTYDRWPYGLQGRTGYTAKIADEVMKKNIAARPVTYLMGEIDILPLGGFDSSCPAMAQGPTRLARGQAFSKYINERYGARHHLVVVPLCGHNARCMFTSEAALPLLFPKQK